VPHGGQRVETDSDRNGIRMLKLVQQTMSRPTPTIFRYRFVAHAETRAIAANYDEVLPGESSAVCSGDALSRATGKCAGAS
jgi:hypothetical protein